MKLISMSHTKLEVSPYGERLWQLVEPCIISMHTDEGLLTMEVATNFVTDFRSPRGVLGDLVDVFIPNAGSEEVAVCFLYHDACYTQDMEDNHPVSRPLADEILFESLKKAGFSDLRAGIVYEAVRNLGEGPWDQSPEWGNETRWKFDWSDR